MSSETPKSGVFPHGETTYKATIDYLTANPEAGDTKYGHAIGMLGQIIACTEAFETEEKQLGYLKETANKLIEKYGPDIVGFMKPELKNALGINLEDESGK